ncbi:MAG: hypothetical protein HFE77_06820 [Clostridiales bacterium]|nr:hypothetical protein [Clostridiales bacterium]
MPNSPQSFPTSLGCKEVVCIDCNRVLDSCRDKDCFENVEVFLTEFGEEIINNTTSVRIKNAELVHCDIYTECVQFNRGFYQITIRFFVKITIEACVCIGKSQEIEGIAVCEKKVVLYGSEGNVKIYKSDMDAPFCGCRGGKFSTNDPTVVVEAVDPVALACSVKEECKECCCCCCSVDDIPSSVCAAVSGSLCPHRGDRKLYVTIGFFTVVRIERPGQYLVQATEYSVPDKECVVADESNPCAVFNKMSFPINEFNPPSFTRKNCGCDLK